MSNTINTINTTDTTTYTTDKITDTIINYTKPLIISLMIFLIFYVIAEYYKDYLTTNRKRYYGDYTDYVDVALEQQQQQQQQQQVNVETRLFEKNLVLYQFGWIIYYSIIIVGLIFALVNLGFNIATILTLLGTIGIALGLALQETIKNIISGIYLSMHNLFGVGDFIALKPLGNINSIIGRIIDFNLYYTTIVEQSTKKITAIPNSLIQNNILTNYSKIF